MLQIHLIDMLHVQDNYNFLLHDDVTKVTAVIDPAEAAGVFAALEARGLKLDMVLNTHHHWDHVGGNRELADRTGCEVICHAPDAHRIPAASRTVQAGERLAIGTHQAEIIPLPGHTHHHIAYYFREDKALFCGDCLFCMGCGRIFEGTPGEMHASLQRLAALPDDVAVYCGHEYTIPNGRFARSVEPGNSAINEAVELAKSKRRAGNPSVPTLMGDEKRTNPFLRTHSPEIRANLGMESATDLEVFTQLRKRKDAF